MTINEFKPFATGDNANIPPQEDWELNPARDTGFQSGVAKSAEVNKALRQATSIASAVAQFVTNNSSGDMLDDGNVTVLANNIAAALKGMFVQKGGDTVNGTLKVNGEVQTTSANSFRSVYGNFGTFWRQDGKTLYLMLTDSGNQYGTFNALRPFQVDIATGNIIMGRLSLLDYTNFDARYYGKSVSDERYQAKGNYYATTQSDARYVQDVKRGAAVSPGKTSEYGPNEAPAGCVLTRAWHDPTTSYGVRFTYRPLQIYINGAWRTISG